MSFDNEVFKLNWEELKLLVEYTEHAFTLELGSGGRDLEHIIQSSHLKDIYEQLQKIKNKFNFNEKLEEWKKEQEKKRREEEQKKKDERKNKVKNKIIDLSKRFPRLLIPELVEEIQDSDYYIIQVVKEMIEDGEIKAKFFSSTNAIVFEK